LKKDRTHVEKLLQQPIKKFMEPLQ